MKKKTRHTEEPIAFDLRQVRAGTSVADIRRKLGMIVSGRLVGSGPSAGSMVGE